MRLEAKAARRIATAALVAGQMAWGGHAALAQHMTNEGMAPTGPLSEEEDLTAPPGQFTLYGQGDVELVRFKEPHLMSICDPHASHMSVGGANHSYPIIVSFDGESTTVTPGNCFAFDAQKVKVRLAGSMPQGDMLVGHIKVIK